MLLKKVRFSKPLQGSGYPFEFEWLNDLRNFSFDAPVTIFVGENGSGKSTLLEALGIQADIILQRLIQFNYPKSHCA